MKSKYILIAFLIFFFGVITALHIDSKFYEPEYNRLRVEKLELQRLRASIFQSQKDSKENEGDIKKWNHFISCVKAYYTKEHVDPNEVNYWAWHVAEFAEMYNDKEALRLAKKWCEIAYQKEPNNHFIGDTYSNLLYALGDVEKAVEVQRKAVKLVVIDDHRFAKWYKQRLRIYERALDKNYQGDITDLTVVLENAKNDVSNIDNWKLLLSVAETRFTKEVNIWLLKDVCWFIVENHEKVENVGALEKLEAWCERALVDSNKKSNYNIVTDSYAYVSFALGKIERAVEYGQITVDYVEDKNPKYLKWCIPRLIKYQEVLKKQSK